jgi:phospholipid-binding lipoprotein MlaA
VGRFAVNTTAGVAGLFDMAKRKPFKWKRRSNGFANTFGFYGIKPGPFLFLPIVGPTTPRDLIGGALDRLLFPFVYGSRVTKPAFAIPLGVIGVLDHRSEFDDTLQQLRKGPGDPYVRSRDFYLQRRQNEIDELKGKAPKNTSGMSEAPTGPVVVKERSGTVLEPSAETAPDPVPKP